MHSRPIAVIEPQMQGVFHAPFNAALLHAVALAWPETPLSFAAEREHRREVLGLLAPHAPDLPARIAWRDWPPAPGSSLPARWLHHRRLQRAALATRERLLFSSISRLQLHQLQTAIRPGDAVRAVLHGDLEQLAQPPRERFPASLFSLHRALRRRPPLGLRYVLLGDSLRANLPPRFAAAFADAAVLDHPYHFLPLQRTHARPPLFGLFGNAGAGRELEAVARLVKAADPALRLCLVGFVEDEQAVARLQPLVEGVTADPLPREAFAHRARELTHALWLAPPESSRLRASGTFLDALSYLTPLIFTANAFLDHYHELEPAIGVRCLGVEAAAQAVLHAAHHETPAAYAAAQHAMLRLRRRFTPQAVAQALPAALDWDGPPVPRPALP